MGAGKVEVAACLGGPALGLAHLRIEQVANRKMGLHHGAEALVEMDEGVRRRVAGGVSTRLDDVASRLGSAEPLAFERQEAQLVRGVQRAQVARELERVDESRYRLEADVLRPEVAVTFDDAGFANAAVEYLSLLRDRNATWSARVREFACFGMQVMAATR